ncbi:uncharacterized protein LOC141685097 [Apium graveolens]|uniref:uncharacterized protein LOC141685097 n=1 Tax=Apium graveolens TaxID=4045 RepID=UPI003D7B697B
MGLVSTPTVLVREFAKIGDVVKWPSKTNKPKSNPDSKLWCEFHGDYGHKAIDCVALRREIEALVIRGYLTEYMSSHRSNHVRTEKTYANIPPPPPHHKVINFIAGGSEMCRETYSQAKRRARRKGIQVAHAEVATNDSSVLQFDASDMEHVQSPQQDGLVISLPIGNCLIKRSLVDNGSAANIMMFNTLQQMGLSEADIEKRYMTLVGFSGETKRTVREIHLPTYASGINLLQKFLVIDAGSTYNIILG